MNGRKLLILIAVVFLSPAFSFAQGSNSTRPDEKAAETALKAKAYELLESLSTQISTLQSAENRARIGSNIAWSLWPHDEKRARALFITVGQDINLGLQPPEGSESQDHNTFQVFLQLRTDTIDRIAKYDPEFAFDFLKTTEPRYEGMSELRRQRERALAVRLAKQVVGTNPDIALKLGRVALAHGFSEELLTLLRPLLRKHREQGVILHKEIVRKLRNAKLAEDYRLVEFIINLARITPPLADETTYAEFTNFVVAARRAIKCDQEHSEESGSLYFCNQLAPLIGRGAKLEDLVSDPADRSLADLYVQINELVEAVDFDGLLQLAQQNPALKNSIYWRAFNLARTTGDLERGQKIAAGYDGTLEEKQRMLKMVEPANDAAMLSEAELEEIQRKAGAFTNVRERANYLADTAMQIGANNKKVALKLLDQLTELVETHKKGSERTEILVAMAVLYCMEKSDRGFALMESQMPKLNEYIDAAVKLDGFDTHYVRDGEWNMSAGGNLGVFLTWLSRNAAHFAWCDFDRAVNLAAQFERAEIRMMAQLKLAQGIVAGPPKRIRTGWGNF